MAFLIPDKILESLICDVCNKYLSVQPVKVYPNRRIKCGRCVRNKKQGDGAVSLFGIIAEKCLFKCINRFDGCREVLLYSQVRDHERTCISNVYRCPICPESDELTSLLLEQHFHKNHEKLILKWPGFLINLSALSEFSEVFLYRLEDLLFFVSFMYSHSEDNMHFNVSHVGTSEQASNIIQQFLVSDNETVEISSDKRPCTSYQMENNWFCIKQSSMVNKSIVVKFELEIINPQFLRIPHEATQSNENSKELASSQAVVPSFKPMVVPFKSRKIYFPTYFFKMFPDVSASPCGTAIIHSNRFTFLQCLNCIELCIDKNKNVSNLYISNAGEQHSLCYFCFQYLKCLDYIKEINYFLKSLSLDMFEHIELACKWECGQSFSMGTYIDNHEKFCKYNFCPLPGCQFQASLSNFREHFLIKHKAGTFFNSHCYYGPINTNMILFVNNHFIFISVMGLHEQTIDIHSYRNIKIMAFLFDDEKKFLLNFVDAVSTKLLKDHSYYLKIIAI